MEKSPHFEHFRYSNEVLISNLTGAVAWLLWAIFGVFAVAGVLATGGLLLIFLLAVGIAIIGIRLFLTFAVLNNAVRVTDELFPHLSELLKQWALDLSDPYPPPVYIVDDQRWIVTNLPTLKRPVVVISSGAIERLVSTGSLQELNFILAGALARARMQEDFAWYQGLSLYLSFPAVLLAFWMQRAQIVSADAIALSLTENAQAAQRALTLRAVPEAIAARITDLPKPDMPPPFTHMLCTFLALFSSEPSVHSRIARIRGSVQ